MWCLFLSNISASNIPYSGIHVSGKAGDVPRRACSSSCKVLEVMLHHFSQDQIYKCPLLSYFNWEWNVLTNFVKCAAVKFNIINSFVHKLFMSTPAGQMEILIGVTHTCKWA
jgi:hypothetical protein